MRCWRRQWCWGCKCCRFCCRWRHADGVPAGDRATAKLLVNQPGAGEGGYNYEVSCDWRFQPPNPLLKQEGLQPAKASFCDNLQYRYSTVSDMFISATHIRTLSANSRIPVVRYIQSGPVCSHIMLHKLHSFAPMCYVFFRCCKLGNCQDKTVSHPVSPSLPFVAI